MPNEYSVAIHNHISRIIETTETQLETARKTGDLPAEAYSRGQLDELDWIRNYFRNNIDLKGFPYY